MAYCDLNAKAEEFLPLRDVVFKKLRKAILTGELKPGERLMEIHLAEKLGVSRTPIREAIRKLELEGLVVMAPRKGAEVAEITEKSLKDVLEVRRALDVFSTELACERITEKGKKALWKACLNFEEAMRGGELQVIARKDEILHNIIVEATGNARLEQIVNNLSEQMFRYRFEYIKDTGRYDAIMEEHRKLYDAILKGDKELAAKIAGEHVDNQEKAIIAMLHLEEEDGMP